MLPFIEKFKHENKPFKFLEIGLGCDMSYGPGSSAALWKKLFSDMQAELWMAERDGECVKQHKKTGKLDGLNVLVGDQGSDADLDMWVEQSNGKFDFIVDDGGHTNEQIMKSFLKLWPTLNANGYYIIEDLHVGFHHYWQKDKLEKYPPMTVVLQSWIEKLTVPYEYDFHPEGAHFHHKKLYSNFPIPSDLQWILCQNKACALHKMP